MNALQDLLEEYVRDRDRIKAGRTDSKGKLVRKLRDRVASHKNWRRLCGTLIVVVIIAEISAVFLFADAPATLKVIMPIFGTSVGVLAALLLRKVDEWVHTDLLIECAEHDDAAFDSLVEVLRTSLISKTKPGK